MIRWLVNDADALVGLAIVLAALGVAVLFWTPVLVLIWHYWTGGPPWP